MAKIPKGHDFNSKYLSFRVAYILILSLFWGFYQQPSFSILFFTIPVFNSSFKLKMNKHFDWTNTLIQGDRKLSTVYQNSHMSQSGHSPQGSQTVMKHPSIQVSSTKEALWSQMKCKCASNNRKTGLKLNIKKTKIIASSPITSRQIEGGKVVVVTDLLFFSCKITADGDCSHEIRRRLLLGRKAMTNLDSVLNSRDITLPTKVV